MANYRDLEVWQKSRKLASHVYRRTARFPVSERNGLVAQMRRAAISVPSNIAEAHGRTSSRDRRRLFEIARGSLFELQTQALISGDLEYVTSRQAAIIDAACEEIAKQLSALIRHYDR